MTMGYESISEAVIASEAKQSISLLSAQMDGLLRRFAPRNDEGGRSPVMTVNRKAPSAPKLLPHHLAQDLPLDVLVGERSILPPPAVALHLFGGGDKAAGDFAEIGVGVVQAEDQASRSDPAQRQAFGAQIVLKHPVVTGRFGILHHPDRGQVADADRQVVRSE